MLPITHNNDSGRTMAKYNVRFGAKMFVRARDTAANVMYYAMGGSGSFLRRD